MKLKKIILIPFVALEFLFVVVLFLTFGSEAIAQQKQVKRNEQMTSFLKDLETYNKLMGTVSISTNGETVFSKSVGYAHKEKGIKNTSNTTFRIGSITKVFTATLVFQLIDEKKLSLDTRLNTFFPSIENASKITIKHLLTHKSGIANFTRLDGYKDKMNTGMTKEEIVSLIKSMKADFKPGDESSYSNSNFWLLGQIIESITKDTYSNQLSVRITKKLGLKNTYFGGKIGDKPNEAHSYTLLDGSKSSNGIWKRSTETAMNIPHGAGSVVSNSSDLLLFMDALFSSNLISASSLEIMKTVDGNFAHGLFVYPFYDEMAYGHDGSIDEFVANMAYFPSTKTGIVLTANGLGDYSFNNILLGLLSISLDKEFALPNLAEQPITLSDTELKKYEGVYSCSELSFKLHLYVENNQLMGLEPSQSAIVLTPYSKTSFKFKPAEIEIVFIKDDYKTFTLNQGGGQFVFKRD